MAEDKARAHYLRGMHYARRCDAHRAVAHFERASHYEMAAFGGDGDDDAACFICYDTEPPPAGLSDIAALEEARDILVRAADASRRVQSVLRDCQFPQKACRDIPRPRRMFFFFEEASIISGKLFGIARLLCRLYTAPPSSKLMLWEKPARRLASLAAFGGADAMAREAARLLEAAEGAVPHFFPGC